MAELSAAVDRVDELVDGGDVEGRLAELARAGGPLRRVICALAARLVECEGFARIGYARLGDYARERLGVSPRSLQELARVGARLAELSALEAALVSGRLPWSKVRLLARFASGDDVEPWIERATCVGVRQLEREVRRSVRGALEAGALGHAGDDGPYPWVGIRVKTSTCVKFHALRRHASKAAGRELSKGDALELMTAEVLSALPVELEPVPADQSRIREPPMPRGQEVEVRATVCATTDAEIPPFLLPLLEELDAADAFEIDSRLRRAVRLEQRLDSELAPLIRQATSREYEWRHGYRSLDSLARECLGMSLRKAQALVRIERVGEVCPELRAAYRDGGLSWVQAQTLAPLLLRDPEGDWRAAWVQLASGVTARCLKEAVDRALALADTHPTEYQQHLQHPERFADRRSAQLCAPTGAGEAPRDTLRMSIQAPADVLRLFDAVLCTLRGAIGRETGQRPSEGEVFDAMVDHAVATWDLDDLRARRQMSKKRHAVFDRDDWRCVFPGCTSRKNLHRHHIVFRSTGGSEDPSNLTTLCAFHHLRGVHEGRVAVRGSAPDALRFELGVRPGMPPLARYDGDRIRSGR